MNNTKSVVALFVLALAGSIGCADSTEEPTKLIADDESASVSKQQEPMVVQALSGIVGVVNVTNMIKMQVTYGRQISPGDVYSETLRLQADIDALRATTSSQIGNLLVQSKADELNSFESTVTTLWNARRDMAAGKEAQFNTYVQSRQALSFEALRQLNTTLIGDGLVSTGLYDGVADSMKTSYSSGLPKIAMANTLGQLVLHMRLIQLQAFELLSQAWADSFFDIDAQRRDLLANLDAQEARFFERMADFNSWFVNAEVRFWNNDNGERAGAAQTAWRNEEVLRNWNAVAEGAQLDVTPPINVVSADFGGLEVSGSIAMMCNREGVCVAQFSSAKIGVPFYAPTQGKLAVDYRCEGVPGVKSVSWENASGKYIQLSCSTIDTITGTYTNATGDKTLRLQSTNDGKAMWTSTVNTTFASIGLCSNDASTGGLVCQDGLSSTSASTWPVSVDRDATTAQPALGWNGERFTRTAQ